MQKHTASLSGTVKCFWKIWKNMKEGNTDIGVVSHNLCVGSILELVMRIQAFWNAKQEALLSEVISNFSISYWQDFLLET